MVSRQEEATSLVAKGKGTLSGQRLKQSILGQLLYCAGFKGLDRQATTEEKVQQVLDRALAAVTNPHAMVGQARTRGESAMVSLALPPPLAGAV